MCKPGALSCAITSVISKLKVKGALGVGACPSAKDVCHVRAPGFDPWFCSLLQLLAHTHAGGQQGNSRGWLPATQVRHLSEVQVLSFGLSLAAVGI